MSVELVIQRFDSQKGITRTQLEEILRSFPFDGEELILTPYAAVGESQSGEQFSVFGFMEESITKTKMNEQMIDGFNATVLRESEKKIPAGASKFVTPYGIRTKILG